MLEQDEHYNEERDRKEKLQEESIHLYENKIEDLNFQIWKLKEEIEKNKKEEAPEIEVENDEAPKIPIKSQDERKALRDKLVKEFFSKKDELAEQRENQKQTSNVLDAYLSG